MHNTNTQLKYADNAYINKQLTFWMNFKDPIGFVNEININNIILNLLGVQYKSCPMRKGAIFHRIQTPFAFYLCR